MDARQVAQPLLEQAFAADLLSHCPGFLIPEESAALLDFLIETANWRSEFAAFERRICLPRAQAWFADRDVSSRYGAQNLLTRQDFPVPLLELRARVNEACRTRFNSLLATLYRDGNDHLTYHADDDAELGEQPVIASVSLGATRRFCLRRKPNISPGTREARWELPLRDGDLLIMLPRMQHEFEHAVLVEPACSEPRLNLTFRAITC